MYYEDKNLERLYSWQDKDAKSFVKVAINCIVKECIDQLYILRNLTVKCDIVFTDDVLVYQTLKNRYMNVEDHGKYRINLKSNNADKVATDINMVINVLKATIKEFNSFGTYNIMENFISAVKQMQKDDKKLLNDAVKNEQHIINLRKQCEEERLMDTKTIEETNEKIQKLRFEVEDVTTYGKYEAAYFTNWERSRREQNEMTCKEKEDFYKNIINDKKRKIEYENRVHTELDDYIEESKNDYLEEIQYWMKHLDDETEKRETEIMNLKMDLEKLNFELSAVRDTYESRTCAIEDWLNYKRIKQEKEAQAERELNAAMRIQAWWRLVMFRKKLGPYRKKKKGKGKKEDGKKKKK